MKLIPQSEIAKTSTPLGTTLNKNTFSDEDRLGLKQELYNSYSESYASRTLGGSWIYKSDYDYFSSLLSPNSKIIDLGCGPGRDAKELKNRGIQVLGVDFSKFALKFANNLGIETKLLDYESELHVLKYEFDGMWTNCSLTTTPLDKMISIFGVLHNMLKPGAPAFFGFIEGKKYEEGWFHSDEKYNLPRFRFRDNIEGLTNLLESNDFKIKRLRRIPKEINGKNNYANFICTDISRL